ncbi:MAG TPA: beta-glycosidase, partial [Vicinamibacteria bacterium]|nr:beta-glycosidase [Vicinamibacteria bacterium]
MRPSVFILPQLLAAALATAQSDTAGVGVYPGDPGQDFAPTLVPAEPTYRNLAFRRPAYHSSSYDFNLTAQLLTDGVSETTLPRWIVASSSQGGVAPQHEREFLLDRFETSAVALEGAGAWLQLELAGGEAPLAIDGVELQVRPRRDPRSVAARALGLGPPWEAEWAFHLSGSDDGRSWHELGRAAGTPPPPPPTPTRAELSDYWTWSRGANPTLRPKVTLAEAARHRFYRITLEATGGEVWSVTEVAFFEGGRRVEVGGPHRFHSSWMSAGVGQEWVAVDLGAECAFDRVVLSWIRGPAEGVVQVSPDGRAWRDISPLAGRAASDDLRLPGPVHGRWVRVLMERPSSPEGYVLSELEVFGRGGLVPRAKPAPPPRADGRLDLAGGAWRIQRDSLVTADGVALSRPGFADADWVVATVPATVLSSYWNAGALPDPNLGDNQLMISDAFFYADFWYRTEFQGPAAAEGRRAFLNFDGVNWKAEVYLNGERLGRVEGAFTRGRFDVTGRLRPGGANALAVRVEKNRTPGSAKLKTLESAGLNGGGLGADNPTYHASIGWDWIPTVRGRNIGLWNDVYVTSSGPVTIDDPFVRTTLPLPDTSPADVRLEVPLTNHDGRPVAGTLVGRFGAVAFEQPVRLDPGSSATVVLDPSTHPGLRLRDPKLWWPNGYGDPHLYEVRLRFLADGAVSDEKAFRAGVRQLTYGEEGGALRIWINGRRFVARGGNWGFPESNLRYRGREYDAAVRYHRDMNFTMIRNWVGQTGDDELYEACDRHGIVVWQDFWLANPYDGPDPEDEGLFLANVRDTVRRIRTHPSVGLYCGRNEGQPPPALESGIRAILGELHGEVHYIPNSASGPVSGHGPYWAERPDFYFRQRATPKLHSEMGMPNVVNAESLRQMIPSAPWPPSLVWGLHDFNLKSAQRLDSFRDIVERTYGGAQDADDWVQLAQFVNYDGYRAMFEAQGRNRMGLLLWMSHPAWPSFAWQTYDYFFDPTAAYFGVKKASEPLHIQWNPVTDEVEVVNYSAGHARGL